MREKYRQLAGNTLVFAVGSFGTRLILFFLLPVYTYGLSAGEYGTFELINTLSLLAVPVLSGAIHHAVLRYGLDCTEKPEEVLKSAAAVLAAGGVLTLILTPFLRYSAVLAPYRWLFAGSVLAEMTAQTFLTYLKATGRSGLFVFLGLVQTGLLALLNLLFLPGLHLGLQGCLLAGVLSGGAAALLALLAGRLLPVLRCFRLQRKLLFRMLAYSLPLIVSQMAWWIIESSDKVMVNHILGSEALGLYSVACRIPALLNVFIALFSQAWKISAFREYDQGQDRRFYGTAFRIFTVTVGLACSCIMLVLRPFLRIYVGQTFYEAWRFVPCLLLASVFSSISVFMGAIYGSLQNSVHEMLSVLLTGGLNIALNLALIPRMGIQGAAGATAISYLFIAAFRILDTRRYFRFPIRFSLLAAQLLILTGIGYFVTVFPGGWIAAALGIPLLVLLNRDLMKAAAVELRKVGKWKR